MSDGYITLLEWGCYDFRAWRGLQCQAKICLHWNKEEILTCVHNHCMNNVPFTFGEHIVDFIRPFPAHYAMLCGKKYITFIVHITMCLQYVYG